MTTLTLVVGGGVRMPAVSSETPHGAARSTALHLTRRGRLVVVLLALLILVGGTLVATRAAAEGPSSGTQVQRYVVSPGDTLWQIASGVARPGEDLRNVVQRIELLNNMTSASVIAGQEILLPFAG
jgi:Tfp pilus assembly protein FimV